MAFARDISEAATRGVLWKKVFLEISQNSQENTCPRVSFFNKVVGLRPAILLNKRVWHRCFPVKFVKFLRTPFLQNTSRRLLLTIVSDDLTKTKRRTQCTKFGIRCKIRYPLLRSSLLCVRGSRKMSSEYVQLNTVTFSAIDLAKNNESLIKSPIN